MITTWQRFQEIINEYAFELTQNGKVDKIELPTRKECLKLDKLLDVYTGRTWDVEFTETEEQYSLYFGQGQTFPEDKVGLAWCVDPHTIIFFERPFTNKPLKILKKLLPDAEVIYDKNDILINGHKVGPSLPTGYGKREGTRVSVSKPEGADISYIEKSDNNTGHIYCLRWDNIDGLNDKFKDVPHHQVRLNSKAGLTTLAEHLTISKEEFEKMLEE